MKSLTAVIKWALAGFILIILFSSAPALAVDTELEATPPLVSFGTVEVGASSVSQTIKIKNWGTTTTLKTLTVTDPSSFGTQNDNCSGKRLNYLYTCTVDVVFHPSASGHLTTTLNVPYGSHVFRVNLDGTGYVPLLEPSVVQIDFKSVPINTTATQTVTLTNVALVPITVASLSIPLGSSFSVSQDCVKMLWPNASCSVDVYFSPTAVQTYTSILTVGDSFGNDFGINLLGSGMEYQPDITLSLDSLIPPDQIDFGSQTIGTSSNPSSVIIFSSGQGNLETFDITSTSGVYVPTLDCTDKTLSAGQTCVFYVTFTPTIAEDYHETVEIENNVAGKNPKSFTVMGIGKEPGKPAVDMSVKRYDFGAIYIGEQSTSKDVTFVNVGEADLVVTGITASEGFGVDVASCVGTFAPSGDCTFQMYFKPTEVRDYNEGTVTLEDNAPVHGHVVVYGVGMNQGSPAIDISEGSHDFGTQTVGTVSTPYSFTLTSVGDLPLAISEITFSGDFASSDTCPKAPNTLAPGSSCVVLATFAPAAAGSLAGAITIQDDVPLNPQTITLTGTGYTPSGPTVELSRSSLNFGSQTINTTGETLPINLKNVGEEDLSVSLVAVTGQSSQQFSQQNNCTDTTIASQKSCGIMITFAPTMVGDFTDATLTITDNAPGSPHTVPLQGSGTPVATPVASLSPASLDFGVQTPETSAAMKLTITNTGSSDLSNWLTVIEGEGAAEFTMSDNCSGKAVEPRSSCTIDITFYPFVLTRYMASLSIADNAANSPQVVILTGNGGYPTSGGCSLMRGGRP